VPSEGGTLNQLKLIKGAHPLFWARDLGNMLIALMFDHIAQAMSRANCA